MDEILNRLIEVEKRTQEYAIEQSRLSERITAALKRIDEQKELVESVQKIAMAVEVMGHSLKELEIKVGNLSTDVTGLKEKPGKRWDSAGTTIVAALITGVITFLLAKLGMK